GELSQHPQVLATGHENRQACTALCERGHELGASSQQMLGVVENQQQLLRREMAQERIRKALARTLLESKHMGNRLRNELCVRQSRQLHQPHAVRVSVADLQGELQCEPALAAAARSTKGEQACPIHQPLELGELLLTSDEAGQLPDKVVSRWSR